MLGVWPQCQEEQTTIPELPIQLHQTTGKNIILSHNNYVAKLKEDAYFLGYIFTANPVLIHNDEYILIRIKCDQESNCQTSGNGKSLMNVNALNIGFTTLNPSEIERDSLPYDSKSLFTANNYNKWHFTNIFRHFPPTFDSETEFLLTVTSDNDVEMCQKNGPTINILNLNLNRASQPIWMFLEIFDATQSIRLYRTSKDYLMATPAAAAAPTTATRTTSSQSMPVATTDRRTPPPGIGFILDMLLSPSTSSSIAVVTTSTSSSSSSASALPTTSQTVNEPLNGVCDLCGKLSITIKKLDASFEICSDCLELQNTALQQKSVRKIGRHSDQVESRPESRNIDNHNLRSLEIETDKKDVNKLNDVPIVFQRGLPTHKEIAEAELTMDALCVICLDQRRTHALAPCGHFCLCARCVSRIKDNCPICKSVLTGSLKIFA